MNIVEKEFGAHTEYPKFGAGDTITVHYKIKEGNKERIQQFRGGRSVGFGGPQEVPDKGRKGRKGRNGQGAMRLAGDFFLLNSPRRSV